MSTRSKAVMMTVSQRGVEDTLEYKNNMVGVCQKAFQLAAREHFQKVQPASSSTAGSGIAGAASSAASSSCLTTSSSSSASSSSIESFPKTTQCSPLYKTTQDFLASLQELSSSVPRASSEERSDQSTWAGTLVAQTPAQDLWTETSTGSSLVEHADSDDDEAAPKLAGRTVVCERYNHRISDYHCHVALTTTARVRFWPRFQAIVEETLGTVNLVFGQGLRPDASLLRYILVPNVSGKPVVDHNFVHSGKPLSSKLHDEIHKAEARVAKHVCSEEQFVDYLCQQDGLQDAAALALHFFPKPGPLKTKKDFEYASSRRYYLRASKAKVAQLFEFSKTAALEELRVKTGENWLQDLPDTPVCAESSGCNFIRSLQTLERVNGRSCLTDYYNYCGKVFSNALPGENSSLDGRPRCLLLRGPPGCGKSLLFHSILSPIPNQSVFTLQTGKWLFDGLRENHRVVRSQDFRLTTETPIEPMLLSMEGQPFSYDEKSEKGLIRTSKLFMLLSSNSITTNSTWREVEVDALKERVVTIRLRKIPPALREKSENCVCGNAACLKRFLKACVSLIENPEENPLAQLGLNAYDQEELLFERDDEEEEPARKRRSQ